MCAWWAHVELFLHTLRFLRPLFTYHIDPMCIPFALRVPLVRWWRTKENALKNSTLPWSGACVPWLRSGQWTYPPPLNLTLHYSPKPTHNTDPAHLIYSHLLMSNSCRVDSQGIAAITPSSPPSLLASSQPFCVWPLISGHSCVKTWCLNQASVHGLFMILLLDMTSWIYIVGARGRRWIDPQLAINLCAWIVVL